MINVNKQLTVAMAVHMEKNLFIIGKRYKGAQSELRAAIVIFRQSGAWAITPERHRTFSKWCMFASIKMKISPFTLQSYASPNFEKNMRKNAEDSADTIMFTGQAARLMRKAIRLACSLNGKASKRRTKWAGIIVASFYIERHAKLRKAA